jgi:hypothetical protein
VRTLALIAVVGLVACASEVDVAELPSIADYRSWHHFTVAGPVPGHGDTFRTIYVNDRAREPKAGLYKRGSVIVKEIADRAGGGPGALRYTAVMRKLDDDDDDNDHPTHQGWLFTSFSGSGGERQQDLCWQTCHKAAPFDGTWFDYGE